MSETYAEKMVERCSQMIVEALQKLTIEDINMYQLGYEKGKADKEKELQGLNDLGALYSEIRADERAKVFKIIEERLNDDTTITFDLPIEEKLGEDIDVYDFLMLAEEIVQQYKSLIFSKLREAKEQSNE